MGYEVIISDRAISDLKDFVLYASPDRPEAAKRLAYALIAKSKELKDFPLRGKVVAEFADPNIRELVLSPFRIVYRVDSSKHIIGVARYWHGRRGYLQTEDVSENA